MDGRLVLGSSRAVGDVDHRLADGARREAGSVRGAAARLPQHLLGRPPGRACHVPPNRRPVVQTDIARRPASRALGDDVEYRLHVGGRLADHLQHLRRGRLPRQRLLCLVEQPRVLDRDHGLVGEGLQQCELLVAEGAARAATPTTPMPLPPTASVRRRSSGRRSAPCDAAPAGCRALEHVWRTGWPRRSVDRQSRSPSPPRGAGKVASIVSRALPT